MTPTAERAVPSGTARVGGLDIGRAVFVVAVVGWHTQALGRARVLRPEEAGRTFPVDVPGVVYFDLLLLAVPFFLTASLVLRARAFERDGAARFPARLRRLAWLAAFWVGVWTLSRGLGDIRWSKAPAFVLSGGNSIFYFLVALLGLTAFMELLLRRGLLGRPRATAALVGVTTLLPLFRVPLASIFERGDDLLLAYWSPLNFLVYPFLAIAVVQLARRPGLLTAPRLAAAAIVYVGLAALQWRFLVGGNGFLTDGTVLSPYARPSLVLGAGVLCLAALTWTGTAPRGARLLSDLSLGIYCVHPFMVVNGERVFGIHWTSLEPRSFTFFLVILGLSVLLAYPLRRGLVT